MTGHCVMCLLVEAVDADLRAAANDFGYAIDKSLPALEMTAERRIEELRILRNLLAKAER